MNIMDAIFQIFLFISVVALAVIAFLLAAAFYMGHGPVDVLGQHLVFPQNTLKAIVLGWLGTFLFLFGLRT